MAEIEIRFTEQEVAQILWVPSEASERRMPLTHGPVAMIEGTLRMVRERFDQRGLG